MSDIKTDINALNGLLINDLSPNLYTLYKLVGENEFIKICACFENQVIKFPKINKIKKCFAGASAYYKMKKYKKSISELSKEIEYFESPHALGSYIKRINNIIKELIDKNI